MQLCTRCSDSSCQAQEDLIAGFTAIEAEAKFVQVRLKMCAATMIRAEQERLETTGFFAISSIVFGNHAFSLHYR
jgi:hypothetical protein